MSERTTDLRTIPVLDHGYVRLINHMGSDLDIIRAARVSYNAAWRAGEDTEGDRKLLARLWSGGKATLGSLPKHSTPFEAVTATFEVMAPIFVFRQWHRHRTQSYNELSARYRQLPAMWYTPELSVVGVQARDNKQGRHLEPGHEGTQRGHRRVTQIERQRAHLESGYALYEELLADGWPKELARIHLGVAMYSHMFSTASLLNWLRFLELRCDEHAQYEVRVYADAIATLLGEVVPETMALWRARY